MGNDQALGDTQEQAAPTRVVAMLEALGFQGRLLRLGVDLVFALLLPSTDRRPAEESRPEWDTRPGPGKMKMRNPPWPRIGSEHPWAGEQMLGATIRGVSVPQTRPRHHVPDADSDFHSSYRSVS